MIENQDLSRIIEILDSKFDRSFVLAMLLDCAIDKKSLPEFEIALCKIQLPESVQMVQKLTKIALSAEIESFNSAKAIELSTIFHLNQREVAFNCQRQLPRTPLSKQT